MATMKAHAKKKGALMKGALMAIWKDAHWAVRSESKSVGQMVFTPSDRQEGSMAKEQAPE